MGVFIEPPFWLQRRSRRIAPHARSVLVTPSPDVLTIEEAQLLARGAVGDHELPLLQTFIRVAMGKVEQDTSLGLLTQTRDVYLDAVHGDVISLPAQSTPLQSVTSIKTFDTAGVQNTLAVDQYLVDVAGRISLSQIGTWPSDLRAFQPWVIRIVSGYPSVALIPPLLVHAVGLLVAHYATFGRDVASLESITEVPLGYRESVEPYQLVSLA